MSSTSNTIALSNNNFTIEFFINIPVNQTANIIYYLPNNNGFYIKLVSNVIYCYLNNSLIVSGKVILQISQWYHVAVVRNNTFTNNTISTFYIFINGILDNFITTTQVTLNTGNTVIGNTTVVYQLGNFLGFIDDVRVTNGISRYLTNFIPPILPFSITPSYDYLTIPNDCYFSYITLLLHFNNTLIDFSNNTSLITVTGVTTYSNITKFPGIKPFSFDGATVLKTPASRTVTFGKDNFTIEFWMYPSATQGGTPRIFGNLTGTIQTYNWYIGFSNNVIILYANNTTIFTGTISINTGSWYHIAIVRYGLLNNSTFYLYVNGILDTFANSQISLDSSDITTNPYVQLFAIGGDGYSGYYTGLLSEIRVTRYVPRYLSNFTLPQLSFPNTDSIISSSSLNYYAGAQIIVSNWLTRISLSGGTINSMHVQYHINFVATLLTQNLWGKIIRLNTFSGDQSLAGIVPLKITPGYGLALDILSGTAPVYGTGGSSGFLGTASTAVYIDTTLNLNTITSTGRDLHMGFWLFSTSPSGYPMGVYASSSTTRTYAPYGSSTTSYWGSSLTVTSTLTAAGMYLVTNDSFTTTGGNTSSVATYYNNGTQIALSGTQNYSAPSDWTVYILASNGSTSGASDTQVITNASNARVGVYTIGNHLFGIDQLNYYNAIKQLNNAMARS